MAGDALSLDSQQDRIGITININRLDLLDVTALFALAPEPLAAATVVNCPTGAHGFVGDTRWWNVKRPITYAERVAEHQSPVADFERLDAHDRHVEDVLLGIRLRDGLPADALTEPERRRAAVAVDDGLLTWVGDRLVLTGRGRLLADAVVRDVLD